MSPVVEGGQGVLCMQLILIPATRSFTSDALSLIVSFADFISLKTNVLN